MRLQPLCQQLCSQATCKTRICKTSALTLPPVTVIMTLLSPLPADMAGAVVTVLAPVVTVVVVVVLLMVAGGVEGLAGTGAGAGAGVTTVHLHVQQIHVLLCC